MTELRLKDHASAQAKVLIFEDGTIILRSYRTNVIILEDDVLTCTGTYSATTRKHIGWFMREYFGKTYQDAKWLFEHNMGLNMVTGELIDL